MQLQMLQLAVKKKPPTVRKGKRFLEYIEANPGTTPVAMFRALGLSAGGNHNHNLNYLVVKRLVERNLVLKEKRRGRVYLYPFIPKHHEIYTDYYDGGSSDG